jgi:hypothetical protein
VATSQAAVFLVCSKISESEPCAWCHYYWRQGNISWRQKNGVKLLGYVGIDLELTVRGKDLSAVTIDAKLGANSNGAKSLFK